MPKQNIPDYWKDNRTIVVELDEDFGGKRIVFAPAENRVLNVPADGDND